MNSVEDDLALSMKILEAVFPLLSYLNIFIYKEMLKIFHIFNSKIVKQITINIYKWFCMCRILLEGYKKNSEKNSLGTSTVVQWLTISLPMHRTGFHPQLRELRPHLPQGN